MGKRTKRKKSITPTHQATKQGEKSKDTPTTSKKQRTISESFAMKETCDTSTTQAPPDTPLTSQSTPELEPSWVKVMMMKLDDISTNMCEIKTRVTHLETEVRSLRQLGTQVAEMEEGMKFINTSLEQLKKESKSNSDELRATKRQLLQQEKDITINKNRLSDLENRMMRDNLVFTGIIEQANEDTEQIVTEIISQKMGIQRPIKFERVHRMGKKNTDMRRPRAIVAKFSFFKDREIVRKTSSKLKGTRIGVHEQFGQETADKRRKLMPRLKEAREKGHYAQLVADTLIVNNERYRVDALDNIVKDTLYDRPPPPRKAPITSTPTHQEQSARNQHADYRSLGEYPPISASSPGNKK